MKNYQVKYRLMKLADLDEVLAIEEKSFNDPWTREFFEYEITSDYFVYLVGTIEDKIVAYIGANLFYGTMEVVNLAVEPKMRRCGIGEEIFKTFIDGLKTSKVTNELWLHVRKSNLAAIKLYEKLGFDHVATEKNYYYDEDALVMRKKF